LSFEARQSQELEDKQSLLHHLLTESSRDADTEAVVHRLDDFFIGHPGMTLSLTWEDGSEFYRRLPPSPKRETRVARFVLPAPASAQGSLAAELAVDIQADAALLRRIQFTLAIAAFAGSLLVSAGGLVLVRYGLRPLHLLVMQIQQLAADSLYRRLSGADQPEELEPLIEHFNELLGRLEGAYMQLEGFNADVAHELFTPLSTLISSTEVALRKTRDAGELREALGSNLEELHRLASIVRDMLFLSHADRGASARRVAVTSLAELARQVCNYHEAALADAQLTLEIVGDANGFFDTQLLQRALSNLIGNATRYAKEGSTLRVEVGQGPSDEVELKVVNCGETIEPGQLPRLFDRFYRGDPSRSAADRHHGLGLAIVAAIARMHGGRPLAISSAGVTSIGVSLKAVADESSLSEFVKRP
jgi:two-component system heavy metal sensor histidine kinase CusS